MSKPETNGTDPGKNGHKPAGKASSNGSGPPDAQKLETQSKRASKKALTPQQAAIEKKMDAFIEELSKCGNVSDSLAKSGLARKTAYERFQIDKVFADKWLDAQDSFGDKVNKEIDRRGRIGINEPVFHNGKKVATVTKFSDTLLIYADKKHENQKKWRMRIIKAGNMAVETVREEGQKAGLTEQQIVQIQQKMVEKLTKVSLI